MRICIYTSIYGKYDNLLQPVEQSVPCDFLCFTEAPWPRQIGAWRVIRSGLNAGLHPRMRAKYFKVLSHRVFPGGRLAWRFDLCGRRPRYDAILWVDGCLRIKDPHFAEAFAGHIGGTGWSMFIHPDRDCVFKELRQAAAQKKWSALPIAAQMEAYRAEGMPEGRGLMAATLIARAPTSPAVIRTNEAWWAEITKWCFRDQLSLPVVLWRLGHDYDKVMMNLWDNPWFDRLGHNFDR